MKETNQNPKENTIEIMVNKKSSAPASATPASRGAAQKAQTPAKAPAKAPAQTAPAGEKAPAKASAQTAPAGAKASAKASAQAASVGRMPGGWRASETKAVPAAAMPPRRKPVIKKPTLGFSAKRKKAPKKKNSEEKEERSSLASTIIIALIYIGFVVGVSAILSVCGIRWANDIFALAKDEVAATVTIPENATVSEVSTILEEAGIIEYPGVFRTYVNFKNRDADPPLAFKAGDYELRSTLNYDQIVGMIKSRKARGIVTITIPEGYTVDEIIDLFVSKGMGTREGFVDAINNYDYQNYTFIQKLKETELSPARKYRLEGYLFPNTYDFYADSGEVAIIDKMLAAFDARFEKDYYLRLEELGITLDQAVTIASIVQKEGKFSEDFYPIAGVFYNRLNSKNMQRLQSDATVQYCLPERKAELSYTDLEVDSPYNTYRNAGLPPSAISNPGWEAIQAALYPEKHSHYFFISDTDGSMIFADTEAQHSANAAKLREAKEKGTSID